MSALKRLEVYVSSHEGEEQVLEVPVVKELEFSLTSQQRDTIRRRYHRDSSCQVKFEAYHSVIVIFISRSLWQIVFRLHNNFLGLSY